MSAAYVLFYSNFCQHCQAINSALSASPIRSQMVRICIDDKKHKIPSFVQSVPTMWCQQIQRVLVGQDIYRLIQTNVPQQPGIPMQSRPQTQAQFLPQQMPAPQSSALLAPSESNKDAFTGFASIKDDGTAPSSLDQSFAPLMPNIAPQSGSGDSQMTKIGKGNGIDNAYERMMAERQREMTQQRR